MKKISRLKIDRKVLMIPAIVVLIVVALFLSTQTGGGEDILSEAIEGGELTLTSVGRNYESLMQFVQNNETQARQLLEAARATLENGKARLNSARRTDDDYVLGMLDNYQKVAQASDVMAQGVDNLLTINENLTDAIYYYSQKNYTKASELASYCLDVLTSLSDDFETSNATLNGINFFYIPSGQKDQLKLRLNQYRNETEIYNQYVLLLQSLKEGKEYLQVNSQLEDLLMQLQNAIANKEWDKAEDLRQQISKILESLRNPQYQNAADLASQLNPNLFSGSTSDVAQELRNRLRNLEGINNFQNYLQGLEQYLEAMNLLQQGDVEGAQQAINEGLRILEQGQPADPELQGLYEGLRNAFMHIRDQPAQG